MLVPKRCKQLYTVCNKGIDRLIVRHKGASLEFCVVKASERDIRLHSAQQVQVVCTSWNTALINTSYNSRVMMENPSRKRSQSLICYWREQVKLNLSDCPVAVKISWQTAFQVKWITYRLRNLFIKGKVVQKSWAPARIRTWEPLNTRLWR